MSGTVQPKALSIDAAMLRRSFDDRTAGRGAKYARDGHVTGCTFDGREVQGTVRGTAPFPYRVRAWAEGGQVFSACSCPVGINCKHGYALYVHWMKNRDTSPDLEELKSTWARMEKDDLIGLLLHAVEGRPDILEKVAAESAIRVGGPGLARMLLGRVRNALEDRRGPSGAHRAAAEIKSVLSFVSEQRAGIGGAEAAGLALSIYGEIVGARGRSDGPMAALADQALNAVTLFRELCRALDPPSRDRFRDRALELFFRGGEEAGADVVLLAVVTPSNADAIVKELDRFAAGGRMISFAVSAEEARATAAEVLVEAGRAEDAISRLSASGAIEDAFLAIKMLMDAGREGRAVELLMARRPPDTSRARWPWKDLAVETLREMQDRGQLSLAGRGTVEQVAASVLDQVDPRSGGEVVMIKALLEASGGPGSFERMVRSHRDRKAAAWAFLKAGDVVQAREMYAAVDERDIELAWAIAQAADREGGKDLREEMTAEALAHGGTEEMFEPRHWPWTEKALAGLDPRRLAAFAWRAEVPAERRAEVMRLLQGKDPELAGEFLDRLSPRLSNGELFALLGVLWEADHDLALKRFRAWLSERLSTTRHYAEVVDGLKLFKAITGKNGREWRSLVWSLLEEYGGRKRLWELIDAEGWQAGKTGRPRGKPPR